MIFKQNLSSLRSEGTKRKAALEVENSMDERKASTVEPVGKRTKMGAKDITTTRPTVNFFQKEEALMKSTNFSSIQKRKNKVR